MGRMGLSVLPQCICSRAQVHYDIAHTRSCYHLGILIGFIFSASLRIQRQEKPRVQQVTAEKLWALQKAEDRVHRGRKTFTRGEKVHTYSRHRERPSAKLRSGLKIWSPASLWGLIIIIFFVSHWRIILPLSWLVGWRKTGCLIGQQLLCKCVLIKPWTWASISAGATGRGEIPQGLCLQLQGFFVPRSRGWGRSQCLGSSTFLLPSHGPSPFLSAYQGV